MLHNVFPDKEKAKSIFKMALDREKFLSSSKINYLNIIVENYYEIIKEMSSALLLLKGIKFIGENSHKEIIDSLSKLLNFDEYSISILQDLRIKRNYSLYEGKMVHISYLENYKNFLDSTIDKLKKMLKDKLK